MVEDTQHDDSIMQDLHDAERARLKARRGNLQEMGCSAADPDEPRRIGLALSGGGIRSATFSLGLLQALSASKRLCSIDYLSTVSGGSYIGAFFGALFVEPARRGGTGLDSAERRAFVQDPLGSTMGKRAVANLREYGRYLTPGGAADVVFGASLLARNWLFLQLVLGLIPLSIFLLLRGVRVTGSVETLVSRSGTLTLLVIAVALWVASMGFAFAYWFTRKEQNIRSRFWRMMGAPFLLVVVAITAALSVHSLDGDLPRLSDWAFLTILAIAVASVIAYGIALVRYGKPKVYDNSDADDPSPEFAIRQAEDKVRGKLTRWLSTSNTGILLLLGVATINLLGERMADTLRDWKNGWNEVRQVNANDYLWDTLQAIVANFWPLFLVALPVAITIWGHRSLKRGSGPGLLSRPGGQTLLALSILFMWLAIWSMAASLITRATNLPWLVDSIAPHNLIRINPVALIYSAAGAACLLLLCFMYGFANLSSLVTFYGARLKKAYIGASNPANDLGFDVDNDGDLIPLETYYAQEIVEPTSRAPLNLEALRPLHLVNATIAQTVPEGRSNVVAYDRKGKPIHVAPDGIVAGHGTRQLSLHRHGDCEDLALSDWTSISGAAASTAIGSRGSLGLSILAMMTNVRLGYWWKTTKVGGFSIPASAKDTMIGYLLSEFMMRFEVSLKRQRRWYLTDGGHFDNTGIYPLLQRQLEFIIVSDNGADPAYVCDDMLRLVQLARVDLDTEIAYCDAARLDQVLGKDGPLRAALGDFCDLACPLKEPAPGETAPGHYAALAEITYRDPQPGRPQRAWLLHIKPRLTFSEPPELLAYRRREVGAVFPQQTTLDQFFDEGQWEAYRRLGELIGISLFGQQDADSPTPLWLPDVIQQSLQEKAE